LSTDIIRGVTMVVIAAVVIADGPVIAIVALAIFATCFATFFRPAIGSYIPTLVRSESELGPANSAFATLGEVSFIVGPAIGGLLIAVSDLALAFIINAVTFAVVAAILWTLPPSRPRELAEAAAERATAEAATDQDGSAPTDPVPSDPEAPSVLQRIFRPVFG